MAITQQDITNAINALKVRLLGVFKKGQLDAASEIKYTEFCDDLAEAIVEEVAALGDGGVGGATSHSDLLLDDGTNPHGTTKTDVGLGNVPNLDTTDAVANEHTHSNKTTLDLITEAFTTALKSAYDGVVTWVSTYGASTVSHLTDTSNPHGVTKTQVGLSNVDNTSDLNKPISTATQNALNLKENTVTGNDHRLIWSATPLSGFTITDNLDGTIDVSSGQILIRTSNSETAPLEVHAVSGVTSLALTDNSVNYLYVDYNSGAPIIQLATDVDTFNGIDKVITHKLSREGTEIHFVSVGTSGVDGNRKLRRRFIETETFTRSTGLIIGETGSRYLTMTAGKVFYGLTRVLIDAVDTSGVDSFEQVYYSGGTWVKSTETQIDNTQYNNAGTLTPLTNNNYRVDYVYLACDDNGGLLHVVLGDTQYNKLADALNAPLPPVLQAELVAMGILIGRIIVLKSATNLEVVETAFGCIFEAIGVTNHNDLDNLNAGDYKHLTSVEYDRFLVMPRTILLNTEENVYGLTGGSSNAIVYSKLIPANTFEIGDLIKVEIRVRRVSAGTNNLQLRLSFSTSPTTTPTYLGLLSSITTQNTGTLQRNIKVVSNTTVRTITVGTNIQTDTPLTASTINVETIPTITSGIYFNIRITNGGGVLDTSYIDFIHVQIIKNNP